jgi:hypothetical protein
MFLLYKAKDGRTGAQRVYGVVGNVSRRGQSSSSWVARGECWQVRRGKALRFILAGASCDCENDECVGVTVAREV